MSTIEIVGGVFLIISCILIIVLVLMQDSQKNGLSGAITGGSTESFLDQNGGRTRDAQLKKWTKILAVAFFIVTIAVNVFAVFSPTK